MKTKTGRTIHQPQPVTGTRENPSPRLIREAGASRTGAMKGRTVRDRANQRPTSASRAGL